MKEWQKIIVINLFIKAVIAFIIITSISLLPFNKIMWQSNFQDSDYTHLTWETAFMTWDSQHYLFLSDHGYHAYQESNRFYPLFPGLIHLGSLPFHNSFLGGFVLSTIISICFSLLFFAFVKKYFSQEIAWVSLVLLLAFPTGFYLSLIYSEGIFLFLTLCFFWFLYKKEFFVAGLFSLFLPLTRPVGIFIAIPFFVFIVENLWQKQKSKRFAKKEIFKLLHALWPFAGLGLLLLFYEIKVGYPFEPFLLDKMVAGQWSAWNIFNPAVFLKSFFTHPLAIHGFTDSIIDRVFFIAYLFGIPLVWKKTTKSLFFYYLLMGGVPFFGNFMSYTRYFFVAFPIFISLASLIAERKWKYFFISLLFLFLIVQALFLILHSLNYWVA